MKTSGKAPGAAAHEGPVSGPSACEGPAARRLALGVAYRGDHYHGWQSQPSGRTVQDKLEAALSEFAAMPVSTLCAGRTDTGVHGLNQVVHFDTPLDRPEFRLAGNGDDDSGAVAGGDQGASIEHVAAVGHGCGER